MIITENGKEFMYLLYITLKDSRPTEKSMNLKDWQILMPIKW